MSSDGPYLSERGAIPLDHHLENAKYHGRIAKLDLSVVNRDGSVVVRDGSVIDRDGSVVIRDGVSEGGEREMVGGDHGISK